MQSLRNGTYDPAIVGGTSYTLTGVIIKKYLSGPILTLDTACSYGLYALDIALQSLRNGTCDAAIVDSTSFTLIGVIIKIYYVHFRPQSDIGHSLFLWIVCSGYGNAKS